MRLLVQQMLRGGVGLDYLKDRYGLHISRGHLYPNLVGLHYDMVLSPLEETLVQQCRGLILDESDDWRCVARGFDKFFNWGEVQAATIDWTTARVEEKLDGSLCYVYYYAGRWHVATTGSPDASGNVGQEAITFAELFWTAAIDLELLALNRSFTYLFELCTPLNRIVVPHAESSVTLIGVREPETGREYDPRVVGAEWWSGFAQSFPLATIDAVVESFDTFSPLGQEGYVIVDGLWNRIKVKHPGYVALHHLKDGLSDRTLLDCVRRGEVSELISAFPELTQKAEEFYYRLKTFKQVVADEYAKICEITDQKQFALAAQKTAIPHALFAYRKGIQPSDFVRTMQIDTLMRVLEGMKDE